MNDWYMNRNNVLLIIFTVVLICPFIMAFDIQLVMAFQTIYIKADGSVYPITAPIQRYGDIYVLTADITSDTDGIVIERDNIRFYGAGYMLQGTGAQNYYIGIDLAGRDNVTIEEIEIKSFWVGIRLESTSKNIIHSSKLTDGSWGINLYGSSNNNNISENNITNNKYGIMLQDSYANTISGNNIAANQWYGIGNYYNCSNNIISENTIAKNHHDGIKLLSGSNYNTVFGNNLANNYPNIRLDQSSNYNTIYRNKIKNSNCGIGLYRSSKNNSVFGNEISNNTDGICLSKSSNNSIYHNNFINNTRQVDIKESSYINVWDDGFEGNFWSNYTGADLDHDGVGDVPHVLDESNVDNYPLVGMFYSFGASVGYFVDVVSNSTVEGFEYFESNSTITILVSNATVAQSYGFCRLAIPRGLLDSPYVVSVNGSQVPYTLLFASEALSIIYFSYEHSTMEITIIPEFPTTTILPLLVVTLLAVILLKKEVCYSII